MAAPTSIEKESLEAHVELCTLRFNNIEQQLRNVETRIDKLDVHLMDIKKSLTTYEASNRDRTFGLIKSVLLIVLAGLLGFIGNGMIG
jgi:chaperonin cofactor prefoldin